MSGDCKTIRTDLVAYLKDEVGGDERAEIELHLATCTRCREELTAMAAVFRFTRSAPAVEASPDFRLAWRSRLSQVRRAQELQRAALSPGRKAHLRYAALAGFGLVALALLPGWLRHEGRSQGTATNTASVLPQAREAGNPWDCVEHSLDWLADRQDPTTGGWHADQFGGDARAEVGISALALLAFLEGTESQRARYETVIERATRFLDASADTEFRFGNLNGDVTRDARQPANEFVSRFNHAAAVLALCERQRRSGQAPGEGLPHNAVLNLMSLDHPTRRDGPCAFEEAFADLALQVASGAPARIGFSAHQLTLLANSMGAPWVGGAPRSSPEPAEGDVHGEASLPMFLKSLESPAQREPALLFFATKLWRDRGGPEWLRLRELLIDRLTRDQHADGSWQSLYRWNCLDGGSVYATAVGTLTLHLCLGSFSV